MILLEFNLPDIDGYQVARQLRTTEKKELPFVLIIAITSNALKYDTERALEAGCDLNISNPNNIRELWARIEGLLPGKE